MVECSRCGQSLVAYEEEPAGWVEGEPRFCADCLWPDEDDPFDGGGLDRVEVA